ncbi:MAG: glutathione synthase [Pseudomonadota bacterium]
MTQQRSTLRIGFVTDPIESIKAYKDSSVAMMRAAARRGWSLLYLTPTDIYLEDGVAKANLTPLVVSDNDDEWYQLGESSDNRLDTLDVIMMRKDPPFDMDYIYATYLLEQAERSGVLVVNKPASLRDANEKLSTAWFPQCCVPTLVSAQQSRIKEFVQNHADVIVKPLDGMGGESIFRLRKDDPNVNVVLETLTRKNTRQSMAQRFIPQISEGDKRILLIDGEPVPYALARIPSQGETRGNLAAGGTGVAVALTDRDRWICNEIAPTLREKQLLFVGIDVIGDYLTEINVTSPTCIRELDTECGLDIGGQLMDAIEKQINDADT